MKSLKHFVIGWFVVACFLSGCATTHFSYSQSTYEKPVQKGTVLLEYSISQELEDKILALDPDHITEKDIREVLSQGPTPRIINVHGGIYPVYLLMTSFSNFLIGMGYPEQKIRDPKSGNYSFTCYDDSKRIAGIIAWYYEREGMRPMIIGHSQGGMQTVKILHELGGTFGSKVRVWDPITNKPEDRYSVLDPLTGADRPVVSLNVCYASAVGAGGFTRFLPNQWVMVDKLRRIPDSVEEFTGFSMGLDILGGDLLGFGAVNHFAPNGKAKVRNVRLPIGYEHVMIPETQHLVKDKEIRDWINQYTPSEEPKLTGSFKSSTRNILWAADVWHSIKKNWCLEAQNFIRAKRSFENR